MNKKTDPRLKIFIGLAIILVIGGLALLLLNFDNSQTTAGSGTPRIKINADSYDFGDVSMAQGLVTHSFSISNQGDGALKLSNISTSCMCTSAVLKLAGKSSPRFGMHNNPLLWSEELKPGQTADLVITFDPNAHGPDATGPIRRLITFYSNDQGQSNVKHSVTFAANVIK